jgi:hypothetical protein
LPSTQRDLTNLFVSESYYRLMQTDPVDDATLLDGTGSLVTYLAVSGTIDAFYFKGDGSQLENLPTSSLPSGVVSSSFQTIQNLYGTNIISGSEQRSVLGLGINDSPSFNNLTLTGDLTARQIIVSSSVYVVTQSFSSGSTIFGDSSNDTHQFTGSVYVSGSIYGTFVGDGSGLENIVALGTISSSQQIADFGFITSSLWEDIVGKPNGLVSSSVQILSETNIVSSSTQTISHLFGTNIISGSGQRDVLGLAETDSPRFNTLYATNGNFDGNLLVGGTITARTYVVSSSVVNYQTLLVSGSSKFGDTIDDVHQFTGSMVVTGSTTINGDTTLNGDLLIFTGSAYMSGSLNVEGTFVLPTTNELPAINSTGSLVISGSNLYLFI